MTRTEHRGVANNKTGKREKRMRRGEGRGTALVLSVCDEHTRKTPRGWTDVINGMDVSGPLIRSSMVRPCQVTRLLNEKHASQCASGCAVCQKASSACTPSVLLRSQIWNHLCTAGVSSAVPLPVISALSHASRNSSAHDTTIYAPFLRPFRTPSCTGKRRDRRS